MWLDARRRCWLVDNVPVYLARHGRHDANRYDLSRTFAGALAGIIDRRRYLIVVNLWMLLTATLQGVLTITHITNEWILLALTFCMGSGAVFLVNATTFVFIMIILRRWPGPITAVTCQLNDFIPP